MDNCINSTTTLLRLLKIKFSKKNIGESILSHGEYPSLLSISDTLKKYQVESLAIKLNRDKIDSIPLPSIFQVVIDGTPLFYTVTNIDSKNISYYDDRQKLKVDKRNNFLSVWTGISMLFEKNKQSQEPDIKFNLIKEKFLKSSTWLILGLFIFWVSISFYRSEIVFDKPLFSIFYFFFKIIGLIVTGLLLWYDVDKHNPTLQNFCSGGKSINCNAVLSSKYANLFGGVVNLSSLSFSYFFGSTVFLIVNQFSIGSITILSLLSLFTIPFVIVSVYYQAIIIKQWCKFCIILQLTLVFEILTSYLGEFLNSEIESYLLILLILLLLIPLISWEIIKPLLLAKKELNLYKRSLNKIKNNSIVFDTLLSKSKKISNNPIGLGVSFTNANAKFNVIKVCNPYCSPCSKAHPILEELFNSGIINLQILFTATSDINDKRFNPVNYFLSIYKEDKVRARKVIDAWYASEIKDYSRFSIEYPVTDDVFDHKNQIDAMRNWYETEKIDRTPSIFINGYLIPIEYDVQDLKNILQ